MSDIDLEAVRDHFFKIANIDLWNLNNWEVRDLIETLPQVLVFIHARYDLEAVYQETTKSADD